MKIDLSAINTASGTEETANKWLIHGNAGTGKSTIAAHFPKPIFIMADGEGTGISKLAESNLIPDDTAWFPEIKLSGEEKHDGWKNFLRVLTMLVKEKHDYKTVVIDCFDDNGILELAYTHHADKVYDGDMGPEGFMAFQNGYKTALTEIKRATHGAMKALVSKGIEVVLLSHTTVGTHKNPSGLDYTRFVPTINGKHVWPLLRDWADIVLFLDFQTTVASTKSSEKTGAGKGKGGKQRVLHTEHAATHEAKNRHGLPAQILLPDDPKKSYETLRAELDKAKGTKD